MKYRNIVIAGDVGTGTSTLGKNLAEKLKWKFLSAGEFFREYAKAHKIPLWDKDAVDDNFERKIDGELADKLKSEQDYVIEAHYSGWFARDMKDVYKILLTCERSVATERMLTRDHTHKETTEEIEKRRSGLYAKFKKLYSNDNYENPTIYDFVFDTTNSSPEETLDQVLKKL